MGAGAVLAFFARAFGAAFAVARFAAGAFVFGAAGAVFRLGSAAFVSCLEAAVLVVAVSALVVAVCLVASLCVLAVAVFCFDSALFVAVCLVASLCVLAVAVFCFDSALAVAVCWSRRCRPWPSRPSLDSALAVAAELVGFCFGLLCYRLAGEWMRQLEPAQPLHLGADLQRQAGQRSIDAVDDAELQAGEAEPAARGLRQRRSARR